MTTMTLEPQTTPAISAPHAPPAAISDARTLLEETAAALDLERLGGRPDLGVGGGAAALLGQTDPEARVRKLGVPGEVVGVIFEVGRECL